MMNYLTLLSDVSGAGDSGTAFSPILRVVGIIVVGIRIAVPLILIVIGMLDMAQAVMKKKEDDIKTAQNALIKKAIAAGLVFLITFFVDVVMLVVGHDEYEACKPCVTSPFGTECKKMLKENGN